MKVNPKKIAPKRDVWGMEWVLLDLTDHTGLKDKTDLEDVRFLQFSSSFTIHHGNHH